MTTENTLATTTPALELAPAQPGDQPIKTLAPFDSFKADVSKLKATAETLTIKDASDTKAMRLARETRLSLKGIRVAIDHRHKELKADILKAGQALDAGKREMLAVIEPLEARMLECEEFAAREALRIEDERRTARVAEITPLLTGPIAVDLGKMSEADYATLLAGAKELKAAREAAAAKAEQERIAAEKAAAEERERVQAENVRLKKEAEEREAAAKVERERIEAERKAEREAAEAKQREAEAAAKKEREEAAAKLKAEQEKAAAERAKLEAQAAKEREEAAARAKKIEDEAKAERARLAAEAEKQRKQAAEAQAEIERQKAAAAKDAADRAAAAEAAALAPEKEKLVAFAATVRALVVPVLKTEKGAKTAADIAAKTESFAAWIIKQSEAL